MNKTFEDIFGYVENLEIIDTHEHLPLFEETRDRDSDFLKDYLQHYFSRDLLAAGLKPNDFEKVIDSSKPLMDRWDIVEPYWEMCRHTGYGRALDISVKGLYGIEKICRSTAEEVNRVFLESLQPGHFKKVLKEKSKIKISILDHEDLDTSLNCDKELYRCAYRRLDKLIYPGRLSEIRQIEEESGIVICSFEDWLNACEVMLDKALASGAVALKCGLAYYRSLKFERVRRDEAEEEFLKIFKVRHMPDWKDPVFAVGKKFQDYVMHHILGLANKRGMVYQFHTGLQEGTGNEIRNSDPSLLSNLFLEYPNVDFDIFHIGYPYQHVVSALAKVFSNVYIDMCWAHIISPTASINALVEWVDSVPINKISAFGGDYAFIDGVYGHQYMARVNVSKALAIKVDDGVFDVTRAKEIAKMLFYDNPLRIFRLEGKLFY